MQNSIYKIKYLLFLSGDWEAWCLTVWGVIPPPPERNTAWNKGRKCFHCLGSPNNLIRPWPSLLYNGYLVFPGGWAAGAWRWPPTTSSAIYAPSGLSWPVLGWTPLPSPSVMAKRISFNGLQLRPLLYECMHGYHVQEFIQESSLPYTISFWYVIFLQGVFLRVQQSLVLLGASSFWEPHTTAM